MAMVPPPPPPPVLTSGRRGRSLAESAGKHKNKYRLFFWLDQFKVSGQERSVWVHAASLWSHQSPAGGAAQTRSTPAPPAGEEHQLLLIVLCSQDSSDLWRSIDCYQISANILILTSNDEQLPPDPPPPHTTNKTRGFMSDWLTERGRQ